MEKAPLIIIGMHRSGTTMITKMLEKLGFFMGSEQEVNSESIFFHDINHWIMVQSNSAWDNPVPETFKNDFHKNNLKRVIELQMKGLKRYNFLGRDKFFKYRSIKNLDINWGWKDPVNTLNIEVWKSVFPNAKVLHVYRNPIDIAESLRVREHKVQGRFKLTFAKQMHEKLLTSRRLYNRSVRLFDIQEGISLWEKYLEAAVKAKKQYDDLWLDVKYEDFLDQPGVFLNTITDFVGLETSQEVINQLTKEIKNDRKYAFLKDENLTKLYESLKDRELITKFGYNDLS